MKSYKLAKFVLKFIKTRRPRFYFHDNFLNQFYHLIIEKNDGKNENSVKSGNRSEKIVIKPCITCIWLNKLVY